jgi:hypothetical protein
MTMAIESQVLKIKQEEEACMTGTRMPEYQSHKKVWALKIKKVHRDQWGIALVFEEPRFAPRAFTTDQAGCAGRLVSGGVQGRLHKFQPCQRVRRRLHTDPLTTGEPGGTE